MKNKILILSLVVSMAGMLSCKKFLDKEPISAATDENFWKNEEEGNSAVAGGYALLRQALTDGYAYYAYGDFATEQFLPQINEEDMNLVSNFQWNVSIPSTSTYRPMYKLRRYDNFYRVIDQANRCIRFVPTIPDAGFASADEAVAGRAALVGEAYFLRAFAYFYMARVWGGVPIVQETFTKAGESENLARSSEADVLAYAKADIEKAIGMLSWGYLNSANRAVRANKGSAYALLAHLEAWAGNYDACAVAAGEVIENGGYKLVPMVNYLSIWKGQSEESIFEIAANSRTEGAERSISYLTLNGSFLATNTGTTRARFDQAAFRTKFKDSTDLRVETAFSGYSTDPICIKYSNVEYLTTDANGTKGNPIMLNNIVVFRLSDIILLKAEALSAIGNYAEARPLLDQIRTKAKPGNGYTGSDANLFDAVMEERSRELFLEGHRFYDLIRLYRARGGWEFGSQRMTEGEFKAGKYYWPVDPTLMTLNPKLVQTPYWRDKM